ncbi:aspartate carbamoyltransferase catalytic subunit [Gracilibacillus sp. S3-1-1]|uniref:Aspartate carbamoyltransferase catalytic subunit n=1 Tax=Gracilibacillus pellucidus TaxID=3095368 RepID=A0ACC6M2I9_9BACI|nr:aspartate carbamoyltransferase catalytic subunit [Gracilibacillus sp. S3-1-1]MDX8044952.1 aspartate carbamoyltransferase catalytic subunit [Gracilibacillus sp. S3-1-1]
MNHFVTMKDKTEAEILQLIRKANEMTKQGIQPLNKQYFAANLFFEPSTRTKMSFVVAERKLGIEPLDFVSDFSSVIKGESIYDTARTFESIGANLIVLRHQEENIAKQLAESLSIPVINAGDGTGEHPTQSLLDLVTIYQDFQQFKGLKVVIAGDIKHSRVARSNAIALSTLGCEVYLTGMEAWHDETLGLPYITMDEAVECADVLMLLRIQHERHQNQMALQQASYLEQYGLTIERERRMKEHAIILHPAPVNRGVEIDSSLVECARSRIFKQMENGVAARMAVIETLLNKGGYSNEKSFKKRKAHIG